MGTRSSARSSARRASTTGASRALCAAAILFGLGCGGASLEPSATDASSSTSDPLPPLGMDSSSSSGDASTGEPPAPEDPRLCDAACTIVLPPTWVYEATPPRPALPGPHVVPAMLRDADGTLTVAELVGGVPRLHRLDGEGRLQWNVPLPLPCEPCELTDVARHPSGDLLLSATGVNAAGAPVLLAARYDATRHALVWSSALPLQPLEGVHVRSGDIAAVEGELVAQLYMRAEVDFQLLQRTLVVAYGPDGALVEQEALAYGEATLERPPLLARPTPDGGLLVGLFNMGSMVYGLTTRIAPPLWQPLEYAVLVAPLDDVVIDAREHAIELGHTFDGAHAYVLLSDRTGVDTTPQWVASLAVPTTTSSPGALALGPDGDPYAAIRITHAPGGTPEPLVGLALARWTSEGELRWQTTLLQAIAESFHPVALAVDDDEGLVIAAVVDGRLRVERRVQGCACEP